MTSLEMVWDRVDPQRKAYLLPLLCFCFFTAVYGLTARASVVSTDEVAMFRTGIDIATRPFVPVDDVPQSIRQILHMDDLFKINKITPIGYKGVDDHLYSRYFPGNSLCSALIYTLTAKASDRPYVWNTPRYGSYEMAPSEYGARIALRLNSVLGALGMTSLLLLLKRYFRWETAITTVLLMGLSSDWWYESRLFFSEIGAGALLITSFYFADRKNPHLCSLFLAASLLFRPTNLLALPVWGYSLWKGNPKHLGSGVFLLGSLGLLALYNFIRFHSALNFGYDDEGFTGPILKGLTGVLLSPGHSMFIYSPILLLAIPGSFLLYNKNRAVTLLALGCFVGYIFMAAAWHDFSGGKVWGARLVVPALPAAGLLVAAVINKLFGSPPRILLVAVLLLGILGIAIQLLTIVQNPVTAIADLVQNGYATKFDAIWSLDRNMLALEIKSLSHWNVCNIDGYSIRMLFSQCR